MVFIRNPEKAFSFQNSVDNLIFGRLNTFSIGDTIHRGYFNGHVWHPALRTAGVEPTRATGMHALRHFYASVLIDAGESVRAVADYLGHSDPGFTLRTYTHLMPSSGERTRRAVDAAFACYMSATSAAENAAQ